jgi:polysaccharide deacetylase family protein (PEP-CTERM system associated)
MNILTFDIEEWFHLLDNDSTRSEEQWKGFEVRIYENMERIFRILEETDTEATFFVIGWIAKTFPDIVRQIASKYQVGSHTMNHQLVWQQSREAFKEDVSSSIKLLEDITGQKVEAFRAPGFSIRESEGWAFEILHEFGIRMDSSVFPAHHAHGGMPSYVSAVPSWVEYNGIRMKEFPIACRKILGNHIVFSGGGYFRLVPYSLLRKWTRECPEYLLAYIHPRDLDAEQPMIEDLNYIRRFKSYYGLRGAEEKLKRWLMDFDFMDLRTADGKAVPAVMLH